MESGGETRRMVIVGGGIAGSLLAKSLQFNAALTLTNLRNTVEPSFAERSVINHRDYLTNGSIVTSVATDITDTEVLTADGHRISYDYLVIATGHRDLVPTTKTERLHQYKEATDFPDKKVTLVHKGPRLLEFIGPKASDKTLRWLKSRKVEVKLEQAVDLNSTTSEGSQSVYKTSIGEIIKADCHFLCAGKTLASTWLNETILKTNLNGNGSLMVDEHLRVNGRSNIFAIGDITDVPVIPIPKCFGNERVEFEYPNILDTNAGTETRVFSSETCNGGGEKLEGFDEGRQRQEDGKVRGWFRHCVGFPGKERCSGTVSFCNHQRMSSGIAQIQRLVRRQNKEEHGLTTLNHYMCLRNNSNKLRLIEPIEMDLENLLS
ncbi:hypothetical protein V6N13_018042 [Hibiscus sabdariffa]